MRTEIAQASRNSTWPAIGHYIDAVRAESTLLTDCVSGECDRNVDLNGDTPQVSFG
jgi:hypothetical protein